MTPLPGTKEKTQYSWHDTQIRRLRRQIEAKEDFIKLIQEKKKEFLEGYRKYQKSYQKEYQARKREERLKKE